MSLYQAISLRAASSAVCVVVGLVSTVSLCPGQSLNPDRPAPVRAGANRAAVDSFIGAHYWTFTAEPGPFVVSFATGNKDGGMLGPDRVRFSIAFAPKTPGATVVAKTTSSGTVYEGSVTQPTRVVVGVAPRKNTLIRETTDYTLAVSGSAAFDGSAANTTPIVGTYVSMVNNYGAVKFRPDGTVVTSSGAAGTWKLFDEETGIYSVQIDGVRFTVTLAPGRGLLQSDTKLVTFARQQ